MPKQHPWSEAILLCLLAGLGVLLTIIGSHGLRVIESPPTTFQVDPTQRRDTTAEGARVEQIQSGAVLMLRFPEPVPRSPLAVLSLLMEPDKEDLTTALLEREVQELFGPDVSLRYDIGALLAGNGYLALRTEEGSGAVRFIVMGNAEPGVDTKHLQERMLASLEQTLQEPTISTYAITEEKTMTTIRAGAASPYRDAVTWDGWEGTRVTIGSGSAVAASQGRIVIVSNDPLGATALLRDGPPPLRKLLEGRIDRDLLVRALRQSPLLRDLLLPALPGGNTFAWSIDTDGTIVKISVESTDD